MTAAQRLRLVLALGVVNLVLATVALSFGIAGTASRPGTAGGPTPGTAIASPAPTTPAGPEPRPTAEPPSTSPTPGTNGPPTEPSAEPSTVPSAEPSILPSAEPSSVPPTEPTFAPASTATPVRVPLVPAGHPGVATPKPTGSAADEPTKPSEPTTSARCHASERGIEASNGKACPTKDRARPPKPDKPPRTHTDNGRHNGPKADRARDGGGRQQATVEDKRREPKSRYRLRTGRRAR